MKNTSQEKPQVSVILEVPINEKQASSRGIEPSLSRLVLCVEDHEIETYNLLARFVESICPSGKSIFVKSICEFVSPNKFIQNISDKDVLMIPEHEAIKITGVGAMRTILASWRSEALVIFFSDEENAERIFSNAMKSEPKLFHFTRCSYECNYLNSIGLSEPFVFFAETHSSLELMGSYATIMACFDKARPLLSMSRGEPTET